MNNIPNNRSGQMKKGIKTRVPLPVWLCYLLIAALVFSGGSMARYTSTASGTATARVARFDMATAVADGQSASLELQAGEAGSTGAYSFTVTNNSEVLVKYNVIVKNVPANVCAVLNGTTLTANGTDDLVFDAKELAMGSTDTCELTFYALADAETQTTNVTVQVHVEQVD